MLKGVSANRMSKIKVHEAGKVVKTIPNASINYGQDMDQLKKMIEIAIRLSPQDPVYMIDKIFIVTAEGDEIEVDQHELELIQSSLFKQDVSTSMTSKISLSIHAKRPSNYRSISRGAFRENSSNNKQVENQENQENKRYDNILRPASPCTVNKRSTTPGKSSNIRSASRGKFTVRPTSSKLPTDFMETEHIKEELLTTPCHEKQKEILQEQQQQVNDGDYPVNQNGSNKYNREASKNTLIEESINNTWKEVSGVTDVKTPPRTFLSPFKYYSPEDVRPTSVQREETTITNSNSDEVAAEVGLKRSIDSNDKNNFGLEEVEGLVCSLLTDVVLPPTTTENVEGQFDLRNHNNPSTPINGNSCKLRTGGTATASTISSASISTAASTATSSSSSSSVRKNTVVSSSTKQSRSKTPTSCNVRKSIFDGHSSLNCEQSSRTYHGSRTPVAETPRSGRKKGKDDFSTLFSKQVYSGPIDDDSNRPSIGTIKNQWEFMRTNFFNNSGEELEWLMVSKRAGAYSYAHKKNEDAEDKYFKSLYDIDYCETKLRYFVGTNAKLPNLVAELASFYPTLMATPNNETALEMLSLSHQKMTEYMKSEEDKNILEAVSNKFEQLMITMLSETEEKFKIARKARDLHQTLPQEIYHLQNRLSTARKDGDEALKNMEKWSKREVETIDYVAVMKEQEEAFMLKEYTENISALEIMRSFLPINIFDISITELQQLYNEAEGFISLELAQELKSNKLLHWLVTHPDDIIFANFLTGEQKAYFENIENLDITEMRALSLILPSKFELDPDNRKLEWRNRFFSRLKQLISQHHGEKVKGSWNSVKHCRSMVELPPLKPDQRRRPLYFFRTKEQSDIKLKQYDDKIALLQKKKAWLQKAEREAKEAKEEYDTVLKEMRDHDFIELYGVEKLTSVKEMAKTEWTTCEQKRKSLNQEVFRLEKAISEAPLSREHFVSKENDLRNFLKKKDLDWELKGLTPIEIHGVFDSEKVLVKRIKPAAKFMSAEQEAMERKLEIANMKSRQPQSTCNDDSGAIVSHNNLAFPDEIVGDIHSSVKLPSSSTNMMKRKSPYVVSMIAAAECSQSLGSNSSSTTILTTEKELLSPPLPEDLQQCISNSVLKAVSSSGDFCEPVVIPNAITAPRRNSILMNANPEMIGTLNKMLSNLSGSASTTSSRSSTTNRRNSIASIPNKDISEKNNDLLSLSAPKEIKKSKSKLLQRLFNPFSLINEEDSSEELKASTNKPPPMSFLDQIKSRNNKKTVQATEVNAVITPATEPSDVQISAPSKSLSVRMGFGGGGGSFLDQIKAHRKISEE